MSSLISSHDYTGPHLEIIKLTRSKVARWRWSSCACKALITASPFLDRLKCSVSSTRREASSTNSPSAPLQCISSRKTPKSPFPSPPAWDGQRLAVCGKRGDGDGHMGRTSTLSSPHHFWDYSSVEKEENIPDVVCVVILMVSKHWARVTPHHRQKWNIQYQDMEMELEQFTSSILVVSSAIILEWNPFVNL